METDGAVAAGGRIGSYVVERKLGEGGMGAVYLARSRGGRAVAVKVARSELAADPVFRERFRAEVAAARAVGGFHTAPVVDADPDARIPWLATAYVPGPTLSERVEHHGPLDAGELGALGAALAEALQTIHGCGLVHRDLKPGNIIMAEDGPRVLDFGIARAAESTRLTATGHAFGTPGFLAPEQAMGEDVTGAADVFALGAVLVAASGGSAFGEGTAMGVMYRSVHEPPDLSAVPEALRELTAACLAKAPGARPGTERLLDWFDTLAGRTAVTADPRAALWREPPPAPAPVAPAAPVPGAPAPGAPVSGAPASGAPALGAPALPVPPAAPAAPSAPAAHTAPTAPAPALPPPPIPAPPPFAPAPDDEAFIVTDADTSLVIDADGMQLVLNGRGLPLDEIETDADLDHSGVAADFAWPEIATVTQHPAGRTRLAVVIVLRDGSAYHGEINARRAARLREWQAGIAHMVGRYLPGQGLPQTGRPAPWPRTM